MDRSNNGQKKFKREPQISTKEWTDAYRFSLQISPKLDGLKDNNVILFNLCESKVVERFEFHSFDEWKSVKDKNLVMAKGKERFACSCSDFLKRYFCTHSLALDIIFKFKLAPIQATYLPLGVKRRRGRPSKHGGALERD